MQYIPLTLNYPWHVSIAIFLTILIFPSQLHPEPQHHVGTRNISKIPEVAGMSMRSGVPRPLQRPSVQGTEGMMPVPDRPRCGRVYAYLWSRDGHVFTSERTIQHDTGLSERAAGDAIWALWERGVLEIVEKEGSQTL